MFPYKKDHFCICSLNETLSLRWMKHFDCLYFNSEIICWRRNFFKFSRILTLQLHIYIKVRTWKKRLRTNYRLTAMTSLDSLAVNSEVWHAQSYVLIWLHVLRGFGDWIEKTWSKILYLPIMFQRSNKNQK